MSDDNAHQDSEAGDIHGLLQHHVRAINAAAFETRQAINSGLGEEDARHLLSLAERCFVSAETLEEYYRDCDASDIIVRAEALASVANAISSSAQRIADAAQDVLKAAREASDTINGDDVF